MIYARTLEILRDLIGFDTTSRNSNLALITYIQHILDDLDIRYELTFNQDKSKANLFATIGDGEIAGLVLSGHTDVVPVDGQDWLSDPFALEQRGDKLFGRGTCDMKGYIAVCLAMAESFKTANLSIPIHFAFSYDEEIGCLGVRSLIEALNQRAVKPLACVVGEPTNMQIVSAHKGLLDTRCTVRGCAGHSSLPDQGVNAITAASHLVCHLQQMGQDLKKNGPFDTRFNPPYSTIHVGKMNGGVAVNIIPELCEFEFDIRNIPAQDPNEIAGKVKQFASAKLLPGMLKVSDKSEFEWNTQAEFPGMDTADSSELTSWMQKTLNTGAQIGAVSYGTEGGLFSEIGIETIICGPGSIEQAHRPNEFVVISELEACIAFMSSIITQIKAGNWLSA